MESRIPRTNDMGPPYGVRGYVPVSYIWIWLTHTKLYGSDFHVSKWELAAVASGAGGCSHALELLINLYSAESHVVIGEDLCGSFYSHVISWSPFKSCLECLQVVGSLPRILLSLMTIWPPNQGGVFTDAGMLSRSVMRPANAIDALRRALEEASCGFVSAAAGFFLDPTQVYPCWLVSVSHEFSALHWQRLPCRIAEGLPMDESFTTNIRYCIGSICCREKHYCWHGIRQGCLTECSSVSMYLPCLAPFIWPSSVQIGKPPNTASLRSRWRYSLTNECPLPMQTVGTFECH